MNPNEDLTARMAARNLSSPLSLLHSALNIPLSVVIRYDLVLVPTSSGAVI